MVQKPRKIKVFRGFTVSFSFVQSDIDHVLRLGGNTDRPLDMVPEWTQPFFRASRIFCPKAVKSSIGIIIHHFFEMLLNCYFRMLVFSCKEKIRLTRKDGKYERLNT